MKKSLLVSTLLVSSMVMVSLSFAAESQQMPQPPAAQQPAPEKFEDVKARLLGRIDDRIRRMSEERACVEKAASHEELRKCRPEMPKLFPGAGPNRPPAGGPAGPGGQRPQ